MSGTWSMMGGPAITPPPAPKPVDAPDGVITYEQFCEREKANPPVLNKKPRGYYWRSDLEGFVPGPFVATTRKIIRSPKPVYRRQPQRARTRRRHTARRRTRAPAASDGSSGEPPSRQLRAVGGAA